MKLSEMEWKDAKIIKDGEFQCFGMLNSDAPGKILSFYGNKAFREHLSNPKLQCVICKEGMTDDLPGTIEGVVIADNPIVTFWEMHTRYGKTGESENTIIGSDCNISNHAHIDETGVIIGKHVTIEEFVSVKSGTTIGEGVIIPAGVVIGGEGIQLTGGVKKNRVPHYGGVYIGDHVVFENHVTVIRGVFEWERTCIDAHSYVCGNTYIAHANRIGKDVLIGAGVMMAGACIVEDHATVNSGATLYNQIHIGKNSVVSIGTVVRKNVLSNQVAVGDNVYDRRLYDAVRGMPK